MSFPRYKTFKSSGEQWIDTIPEHWETWKLSHAFKEIGAGTTPKSDNLDYYDNGEVPWINTGDLNDGELFECEKHITEFALKEHSSLKVFPERSLVIAMYGATIGKLAQIRFSATVNQACCVFSGDSHVIEMRFLFYWFLGMRQRIISMAIGGGQPNISQEVLRSLRVPTPPQEEQLTIAAFLDCETAKIDALIAEQQRLIELLKEKRQAVISHAVTKGLDPEAAMKVSGIEWLGDIPAHWDRVQLGKVCLQVSDGPHFSPRYVEDGILFLSARNIKVDGWSLDDAKFVSEEDYAEFCKRVIPKKRDVLYTKGGTTGVARVVDFESRFQVWVHVAVLKIDEDIADPYFVAYALNSARCYEQAQLYTRGATNNDLGLTRMIKIWLALPPLAEQVSVTGYLNRETARIDALTAEAQAAIGLLQERRTALISAAVTGKIDVRGLAKEAAA